MKREDELVRQTLATNREDKGRMGELEDYVDSWVRCCEEADVVLEQRSLAKEEVKQHFERCKDILEVCGEREMLSQKSLGSCPRAATQRVRAWNGTWMASCTWSKKTAGTKTRKR